MAEANRNAASCADPSLNQVASASDQTGTNVGLTQQLLSGSQGVDFNSLLTTPLNTALTPNLTPLYGVVPVAQNNLASLINPGVMPGVTMNFPYNMLQSVPSAHPNILPVNLVGVGGATPASYLQAALAANALSGLQNSQNALQQQVGSTAIPSLLVSANLLNPSNQRLVGTNTGVTGTGATSTNTNATSNIGATSDRSAKRGRGDESQGGAGQKKRKKAGRPAEDKLWKQMFDRLVKYKEEHGDCLVPVRYQKDPKLGAWVRNQRIRKDAFSEYRRERLDSIGFDWSVKGKQHRELWDSMFARFVKYRASHGNCMVPQRFPEDPQLGTWVHNQRLRKDSLPKERRALLNSVGFVWSAINLEANE